MKETIIKVQGMACGGCENRVKNAIKDIEGVENVIADHTTGEVIITTNDNVSQNIIEEVIEDIGYEVVK